MLHLQKREVWNRPKKVQLSFPTIPWLCKRKHILLFLSVWTEERIILNGYSCSLFRHNFTMDLDSEPKPTYLSPSHKLTLWTLQSQRAIVMIFRGKIIQRLHCQQQSFDYKWAKIQKAQRVHALASTFSSRSWLYPFPSLHHLTDQTTFYIFVWVNVSPEEIPAFLSSPILCCALCSSLRGDLKEGRGRVSAFRPYLLRRMGLALTNPTHLPLQDVLQQTKMQHRLTSFSKKLNMLLSASSFDSSNFSTACLTSSSGIFPKRFFL